MTILRGLRYRFNAIEIVRMIRNRSVVSPGRFAVNHFAGNGVGEFDRSWHKSPPNRVADGGSVGKKTRS